VISWDIPKKPEPLPKFLDDRDAARLMAAADSSDRLVMELMAGLRCGPASSPAWKPMPRPHQLRPLAAHPAGQSSATTAVRGHEKVALAQLTTGTGHLPMSLDILGECRGSGRDKAASAW
jgi:hypothetical protein